MKLMVILLCAALLAPWSAAWAGLFPEETGPYHCRCKGQQEFLLFIPLPSYGPYCGSGYVGGAQGQIKRNLPYSKLPRFVGSDNAQAIKSGAGCRYLPKSGWNCGKGEGGSPPSCIND
jgi:hypothetical protein